MNKETYGPAVFPAEFSSERAIRNALGPQTQTAEAPDAEDHWPPEGTPVAAQASPTGRAQLLRRWSVAELLAGALTRPPAGGVAR